MAHSRKDLYWKFTGIAEVFPAKAQLFVWQQLCEKHSGQSASPIRSTLLDAFSPRGKHETFSPLTKVYISLNIFFPSISLIKKETNYLALQMAQFILSKLLKTNFQGPRPDLIMNCCWHTQAQRTEAVCKAAAAKASPLWFQTLLSGKRTVDPSTAF